MIINTTAFNLNCKILHLYFRYKNRKYSKNCKISHLRKYLIATSPVKNMYKFTFFFIRLAEVYTIPVENNNGDEAHTHCKKYIKIQKKNQPERFDEFE